MGKGLEQTFLQRRYTNDEQAYKRWSTLLIIREIYTKTKMRYYLIPFGQGTFKKTEIIIISVSKDVEKLELLCTVDGNVKCIKCSHYGKLYEGSSKIQKQNYHVIQQSHFWIYPEKLKEVSRKDICTPVFIATLFTIARRWKQP